MASFLSIIRGLKYNLTARVSLFAGVVIWACSIGLNVCNIFLQFDIFFVYLPNNRITLANKN